MITGVLLFLCFFGDKVSRILGWLGTNDVAEDDTGFLIFLFSLRML